LQHPASGGHAHQWPAISLAAEAESLRYLAVPAARSFLHVVTASQRRGAETFAVDLVTAPGGADGSGPAGHRLVALTDGPGGDELGVPALGTKPLGLATLRALRREAR